MSDTVPQASDPVRKAFEAWYAVNAFDYVTNPIGSRECGLQWKSWQAALASQAPAAIAEPACFRCHRPQTRNPHPKAGDPSLEFGYEWHCIPCLVQSRAGWAKRCYEAKKLLAECQSGASPAVSGSALNAPVGQLGRFEMFDYPDGCSRPAWIPEPASPAVSGAETKLPGFDQDAECPAYVHVP